MRGDRFYNASGLRLTVLACPSFVVTLLKDNAITRKVKYPAWDFFLEPLIQALLCFKKFGWWITGIMLKVIHLDVTPSIINKNICSLVFYMFSFLSPYFINKCFQIGNCSIDMTFGNS